MQNFLLYFSLLDLINLAILGERYKLWSSSLWNLLHFPFASLLGLNIRLKILFSNTFSLCSSLNVRDHVSQLYSTTGRIDPIAVLPNALRPSKIYCAPPSIISQVVIFLWQTVEIDPLGHVRVVEALQNFVLKVN